MKLVLGARRDVFAHVFHPVRVGFHCLDFGERVGLAGELGAGDDVLRGGCGALAGFAGCEWGKGRQSGIFQNAGIGWRVEMRFGAVPSKNFMIDSGTAIFCLCLVVERRRRRSEVAVNGSRRVQPDEWTDD